MSETKTIVDAVKEERELADKGREEKKPLLIAVESEDAGLVCDWRTGECAVPGDQPAAESRPGASRQD